MKLVYFPLQKASLLQWMEAWDVACGPRLGAESQAGPLVCVWLRASRGSGAAPPPGSPSYVLGT